MLAKFDARRGARLGTFLRCIAKDVTAGYFRTEYRRRRREQAVGEQRHTHSASAADEADMADFINTLTPGEQEFLDQYLLGEEPADGHRKQYSSTNIWKRASRIRKKLRRFFRGDPGDR
jgi:DNA-directed RNA polymerase specialized sigma24 family protein